MEDREPGISLRALASTLLDLEPLERRHGRRCPCASDRYRAMKPPPVCDEARLLAEVKRLRAAVEDCFAHQEGTAFEWVASQEGTDKLIYRLGMELTVLRSIAMALAAAGQSMPLGSTQVYVSRAVPEDAVLAARAWRDQEGEGERGAP